MTKLTHQQRGILSHYTRHPDRVDPRRLEEMADHLLGLRTGRRGRKASVAYPVLTERQERTRAEKESPAGDLVEILAALPTARALWAAPPPSNPDQEFPETPEWGWCDEDLDESWEVAA